MIRLFDSENIDQMPEPKRTDSKYVKTFFHPLIKGKTTDYISNVKTTMALLSVDDIFLPISINEEEYENSYVSSLYSHYISYAIEELHLLKQPVLEKGLAYLIKGAGLFLKKTEINKVIYVNNWLFSTNLQTDLNDAQIKKVITFLTQQYPDHMIVFRSLSDYLHKDLIDSFKANGFKELASRQVYIAKPWNELNKKQKSYIKSDNKLLEKQGYELIEEIEPTHQNIKQIETLYNELYINKYSAYNPLFTTELYRHFLESKSLKLMGISKDGELIGCIGYWKLNGVMTTPILGYKVELGNQSGLYRILTSLLYQEAEKHGVTLHRSAGASEFKMNRGATSSVEYSMIYNKHLPLKRRVGVGLLRFLCNQVGVKLLKDKKL